MGTKPKVNWLQVNLIRTTRVHFYFVFIYGATLIAADAGHLFSPHDVLLRWKLAVLLLSVTAIVWYSARRYADRQLYYQILTYILIAADIGVAAFSVHTERGMASKAVALFVLPILVATILYNRVALFTTAALCTAAYWLVSLRYFILNFNQGYKLELYTTLSFYSAGFFVIAALLWVITRGTPGKK